MGFTKPGSGGGGGGGSSSWLPRPPPRHLSAAPPLCRYNSQDISQSMLASVGGSLDSLDEAGEGTAATAAPYASFDGEDGSFLMALRQSKRKSIRQVPSWGEGCSGRTSWGALAARVCAPVCYLPVDRQQGTSCCSARFNHLVLHPLGCCRSARRRRRRGCASCASQAPSCSRSTGTASTASTATQQACVEQGRSGSGSG